MRTSRRSPRWSRYERKVPSRRKPTFSATRSEAVLPGSVPSWSRASPSSSSPNARAGRELGSCRRGPATRGEPSIRTRPPAASRRRGQLRRRARRRRARRPRSSPRVRRPTRLPSARRTNVRRLGSTGMGSSPSAGSRRWISRSWHALVIAGTSSIFHVRNAISPSLRAGSGGRRSIGPS